MNKFLTVIWFILRPKYYLHFFSLIKRKFLFNHDTDENRQKATVWAASKAIAYVDALRELNLKGEFGFTFIKIKRDITFSEILNGIEESVEDLSFNIKKHNVPLLMYKP